MIVNAHSAQRNRCTRWLLLSLVSLLSLALTSACVTDDARKASEARRELGVTYMTEGNTEAALRELVQAKKLNPRDAKIRHALGMAFFAKEVPKKAEEELKAAIRLDPGLSEARLNLSSLYLDQQRFEEAIVQLKLVTEDYLYRQPARAWNNLGWAYYKTGKRQEALRAYQKALQIAPQFCQALHNASLLQTENQGLDSALNFAQRAVQNCPQDLRFRLQLGQVQAQLKRVADARTTLQEVAEKDPNGALGAEAKKALRALP